MWYLIILLLLALIVYTNYEKLQEGRAHDNIPIELKCDSDMINMGVIPESLTWVIPVDYELREDYKMWSRIEPIFIEGHYRPLWGLIISLKDTWMVSETRVLYDLEGNIYEH